ncbi:ATP-binding protein [Desulfoferula mesophila]|uniref:ATP-binding protein n=1 Tax=Desulfoferula mesophila TaxID=3058419 RepID=A0AAU9ES51_9BACT|nr:ATP-binding protein [Desulfoferula mesophilus]
MAQTASSKTASSVYRWITGACFVAFSGYHLWTTAFGMPVAYLHRPVFLTFAMPLGFLIYSIKGKKHLDRGSWMDMALAVVALICFATIAFSFESNSERMSLVDPLTTWQLIAGGVCILLVLELTRRTVGLVLSLVAVAALAYAFFGTYMPAMLAHQDFSLVEVIDYLNYGLDGIYSVPVGVASTYIVVFIIFGTFLEKSGAGDVMMDLGRALAGHHRGGPAKIGVITSAFFGSISGSAAANVYATGTFTIPMMKRIGYSPAFAGAVEASSSTGGQLVPPVMGAAAFLMADILGVPYLKICAAALIPSVLYFLSLLLMIDFEAARKGLQGMDKENQPSLRETLKRSYLLLPILVLLVVMLMGYTPFRAAFAGTLAAVLVTMFSKEHRMGPRKIIEALEISAQRTILIASACAAAGIIIGVVTLTGIGLNISSVIITSSGGYSLVALALVMVASIIMGMGTPTTVAYIIVATLGVPSLIKLGFAELPSHFFVFYFGVLSMVTPPVAVAAYAAAEIAKANMMKIGFTAVKLCFVAFLIPYVFIYDNSLLMQGPWSAIISEFFTAVAGVVALAAAFQGWFLIKLRWQIRATMFVAAISLILPGISSNLAGLALFAGLVVYAFFMQKKQRAAQEATQPA